MSTGVAATFNYKVVRQFSIMTVVWGIVGMLVGVIIAAQSGTRMLAHKDLLDEGKIQLLAAYVWGLSNVKTVGTR